MKIIHFISGLYSGGTEKNLLNIINNNNDGKSIIFSFNKKNYYLKKKKNIKIFFPKKNNKISLFYHLLSIPNLLKKEKPNLVVCWMSHANVLGGLFTFLFSKINIIWNIRSSGDEFGFFKKNFFTYIFQTIFSYFIPKKIIFNSTYSLNKHLELMINKNKCVVIYNGFKVNKNTFKKKNNKKINYLCVARYHPIKNHFILLDTFLEYDKVKKNWSLTLIGRNINKLKSIFLKNKKFSSIRSKIIFIEKFKDLNKEYSKYDFHILTSISESFPNVVGEAISHGLPALSANVGDVKKMIFYKKFIFKSNKVKNILKVLIESEKVFFNRLFYLNLRIKSKQLIDKKFSLSKMLSNFQFYFNKFAK